MTKNALRADLPAPPDRIARLPVDKRGFPVPRFVALINGEPDHRLVNPPYMGQAVRFSQCWICGHKLGAFKTFLIGPMCTINRVSSEPAMHRECALYAVKACPFLSKPHMRRREAGLPADIVDPAGGFIKTNPGVMCVWTTKTVEAEIHSRGDGKQSYLFFFGDPIEMQWFTEARPATRDEILDAVTAGLPALKKLADEDGAESVMELGRLTGVMIKLLDVFPPAP